MLFPLIIFYIFYSLELCRNHIDDIYKIAVSTFAFITLLNLCQKFNFNTKVKTLQLFGTQSLAIYILQFRLCNFGNEIPIYIHNMNPFVLFLLTLIVAIPISYICCIVTKIIYTNSFLSFFLFGKKSQPLTSKTSITTSKTIHEFDCQPCHKNTGYLYAKMGITMFISLYTTS